MSGIVGGLLLLTSEDVSVGAPKLIMMKLHAAVMKHLLPLGQNMFVRPARFLNPVQFQDASLVGGVAIRQRPRGVDSGKLGDNIVCLSL